MESFIVEAIERLKKRYFKDNKARRGEFSLK